MAQLTMTMDGDKMCIAFFRKKKFTLTTSVSPEGSGTITGSGTYNKGETVTVVASPTSDYELDHFEVNGETVAEDEEEPPIPEDSILPQDYGSGDGTESDPWTGIQEAVIACPSEGTVYCRAGYYRLVDTLGISKPIKVIGEGREKVFIESTVTTVNGIYTEQDNLVLQGFTFDCASQVKGQSSGINIQNADYVKIKDVEVKNTGYYGINMFKCNYAFVEDVWSHDNYRHGIHPQCNTESGQSLHNTFRNFYAWNNGFDGFNAGCIDINQVADNIYENIQCWDNGRNGISIGPEAGSILSDFITKGSKERGLWVQGKGLVIKNGLIKDNGINKFPGIYIANSEDVSFDSVIVRNNYSGVELGANCKNTAIADSESNDDRTTPLQRFGIEVHGSNDGITLSGCQLSPNAKGEIYNPDNVEIIYV